MKQYKFKVGDIVSNGTCEYLVLELYDEWPSKVRETTSGTVFIDENLRWKHINWKLVKSKKTRVFK